MSVECGELCREMSRSKCMKKALHHWQSIDKSFELGYTKHEEGATGRRFTPCARRSNRLLRRLGGYFFLSLS